MWVADGWVNIVERFILHCAIDWLTSYHKAIWSANGYSIEKSESVHIDTVSIGSGEVGVERKNDR